MTSASDGRAIRRCSLAKTRTSISAHASSSMCDRTCRLAMAMPPNRTSHAGESRLKARSGTSWRSRSMPSSSGENRWRDVYANYQQFGYVQVQGGQFKLPFSMDENTSPTNLDFVYRSLAARVLAPGRDRGVMVHGRLLDRIVRYELGLFDQDGRNARTRNPERVSGGRTLAARVVAQPFRSSKSIVADLQAGLAFTSSDVGMGLRSLRGLTTFEETFFDPDLWVHGRRQRAGFELRWRPGPFSFKSEYIRVTTERRGQSVEDTDLSPLLATGWYSQRHVGDYRREENRRPEQTAPAVHARRPRRI